MCIIATVYTIHVYIVCTYYIGECEVEKKGNVTAKYSSLPQPQQGSVSPVVLPVRDAKLHAAVLAEVALQPHRFLRDLVQNSEH